MPVVGGRLQHQKPFEIGECGNTIAQTSADSDPEQFNAVLAIKKLRGGSVKSDQSAGRFCKQSEMERRRYRHDVKDDLSSRISVIKQTVSSQSNEDNDTKR